MICIENNAIKTIKNNINGISEKNVVVMSMDEKPLRFFESIVLLFALRGSFSPFQCILSYYYLTKSLNSKSFEPILIENIKLAQILGFIVCAVVSDQSSTYISCYTSFGIVNQKSYFEVNNNKSMCYIYDAIHLIRSIRNNLFAREIEWLNNNLNSNILLELYALRKKCKFIPTFSKKRTVCV